VDEGILVLPLLLDLVGDLPEPKLDLVAKQDVPGTRCFDSLCERGAAEYLNHRITRYRDRATD
jgi:hypothetical protein